VADAIGLVLIRLEELFEPQIRLKRTDDV
jgi:hypothetical protein